MAIAKFDISPNKALQAQLALSAKEGQRILMQCLNEAAQIAFAQSQRVVPDSGVGTLRSSGVLNPAVAQGESGALVTMGYGGAASAYALRQHEDESLRHPDPRNPRSRANGQAHYLAQPVQQAEPELTKRLKAAVDSYLKGLG